MSDKGKEARPNGNDSAVAPDGHVYNSDSSQPIDRLPPNNPEAEEAVLGSILMDPESIWRIPFLRPQHFYRERNGAIFRCVMSLAQRGTPVDFVTVSDELKREGRYDEVGGLFYLSHVIGVVPTAVHIEHYAKIVERTCIRRQGISAAGKVAAMMYDDSFDLDLAIPKSVELLGSALVARSDRRIYSPADLAEMFFHEAERLAEARDEGRGLMTGTRLDQFLHGLKPPNVYMIAARPGMGKSTIAQGIARKLGREGKKVLLAAAEMTALQLMWREASYHLEMDANELERKFTSGDPEGPALLARICKWLDGMGVHIFDAAGMTSTEIRAKAAQMKQEEGLDLVVIDYAQRLADASSADADGNDVHAMSRVSGNICDMAKALHVPVLLVSQLSRACEGRPDKRPILSDLRGSGALEQDAYAVMFLYRDEKYNKQTDDRGIAEVSIAKNRGGPDGIILRMVWRPDVQTYADYEPEFRSDPPAVETYSDMKKRTGRNE
jgi:replicative DNA helicase